MTIPIMLVTDMDGTLLDHHTYSYSAALPALHKLRENQIPVILNSSKTRAELEALRQGLELDTPVIVENGAAIYFPESLQKERGVSPCVKFGTDRAVILDKLHSIREEYGYSFEGFSDWTQEAIMQHTGLAAADASRASNRGFSEPLLWHDSEANLEKFQSLLEDAGLSLTRGGRFIHVAAPVSKGDSLLWLKDFYSTNSHTPVVIALGDSDNDVEMLEAADYPVLIKSPVRSFPQVQNPALIRSDNTGPEGWNETVLSLLKKLQSPD